MTHDWKDALSALKGSLSPGEGADSAADASDTAASAASSAGGGAAASARTLRIFYEKKGRAGKPATIIDGFDAADDSEALATARTLKQRIGCGGSARGGEILLQGDRRQQAADMLRSMGYKVKGG
ncbi:MAG: translation initiation factor [Muribaculaceae bacterium]|nr:translation initiation factor [Muribaculaceae bacterium]MDE7080919.1 translation initiation factor [Muribaculaceae bacterium]